MNPRDDRFPKPGADPEKAIDRQLKPGQLDKAIDKALKDKTRAEQPGGAVDDKIAPHEPAQERLRKHLPLTTDDPNFDPDWDWTLDERYDLFVRTDSGSHVIENVRLPYFSNTGPAANDFNSDLEGVRDILPEDGWVLLTRNFGAPGEDDGAVFPHFILYNRFRGLLRLFYFNPHFPEAFTYGVVTMQKQAGSNPFGLLTFTDESHTSLSDFDPERQEVFIGKLEPLVWNYADFLVVGYDPDLPDDAKLFFTFRAVKKSAITLEGEMTLDGVLEQANLAASKSGGAGSALAVGEKSAGIFKGIDGLKKAIKKSVGEDKLEDISLGDMTSLVSAGIALFKLFLGGSKPKQTQVLKFKGELDLSGTIELPLEIGSFLLRVPGARHLGDTDLPFYDKPLGVFNLREKPTIDVKTVMEMQKCRNTDPVGPKILTLPFPKRHEHRLRTPRVVINPDAGLKAEVEAAYVQRGGRLDFASASADGYFPLASIATVKDALRGPANCNDPAPELHRRRVALRLTVTPDEPVEGFTPVSIIKLYPVDYSEMEVEL